MASISYTRDIAVQSLLFIVKDWHMSTTITTGQLL